MKCEEFENEWQNLEDAPNDAPHLPAHLEAHRQACTACSQWVAEIDEIRQQARQLLSQEQPSDRLWEQIQRQLQQEGVIKKAAPREGRTRPIPVLGWLPQWSMSMAYAAVFLLAFGVVYLHNLITQVPNPPRPSVPAVVSASVLSQANLASLGDQEFEQLMEKVPAEHRPIYEANLQQVNNSIYQINQFLSEHPEDMFAHDQLVTAFEQKHRLWETLVQWEEF
ncbi:MAG: anti-sigma factor [Acidobacteria bacterium]|nr:anti-sigma factor [Acidobacteriota bacterium]